MKNNKLFVALACLSLLVTGCNKDGGSSSSASTNKPSTSSNPPASQTSQNTQNTTTSQQEEPPANDDFYYSLPFEAAAKDSGNKWKKGYESVWTFKVSKNHAKMEFAFAAQMSSSSHGDHSLYMNHETAGSDNFEADEANDGTCRIELKVNGVAQTVTTKTYTEAGLTDTEMNYFRVASFAVTAGEVVVSMKTHAQAGYRLVFGDDARLFYPKADGQDPAYVEPQPVDAYKVTFVSSHCKIYEYEGEDYTVVPKEITAPINTTDSSGKATKYVAPDADGNGEVKPQVNFKVICDQGYEVDTNCIAISGTEHNEWNHLDDHYDGIFGITTIKSDLTVTVTPVAAGTLKAGYVANFVTEHCSIKVYTAKNFATEDTQTPYMSRNKNANEATGAYDYAKGDDAQISFEIVPEVGYEFVSGLAVNAEAKANAINYIAPEGYNKIKRSAENRYNLTKVSRDLTITIKCTAVDPNANPGGGTGEEEATGFEVTFALSHCSVVVYAGKIGAADTVEDAGPKFYTRDKDNPSNYTQTVAQAQFNFKVVPEEGYAFDDGMADATSVGSADVTFIQGTFKNLKKNAGTYEYNLTQVGSALTITINCAQSAA